MVRTITEATRLEAQKNYNRPIELFLIFLDTGTLYLVTWPHNISFYDEDGSPQTYTSYALTRSPIRRGKGMEVDQYTLQIDNVDRTMGAVVANTEIQGREVEFWKIFLGEDGAPKGGFSDRIPMFRGYMDSSQISEYSLQVQVVSGMDALHKSFPGRMYTTNCYWTFGDSVTCGVDVPELSGTINAISADGKTITLNENITDEHWAHGALETGGYMRVIVDVDTGANQVELEFPLPADVEATDSYTMEAGCNKAFDRGDNDCDYWNNQQFYGGFRKIPQQNVKQA